MDLPSWAVNILTVVGGMIAVPLGAILVGLLLKIAKKMNIEIDAKDQDKLHVAVDQVIGFVHQTYVSGLKDGAEDGKLTKGEAMEAIDRATKLLKAKAIEIGSAKLTELTQDEAKLKDLIESRIPLFRAKVE